MEKVKMTYEKPTVQKVEFDFKTRIASLSCSELSEAYTNCLADQ